LSLYQTLNKTLEPVLGERTQMVLEEGVRRLGVNPDSLDHGQAEVILKRLVYRELQSKMSPAAARSQIEEVLKAIGGEPGKSENKLAAHSVMVLSNLEVGLRRFSLYLDWLEVGRLRGLLNVIKQDPEATAVRALLREGQEVLAQLEEKLQAALLRQTRDIADLQMSLERVQSVGGPKVRRLETLLRQIQEAHEQETLAPAEVERARALAAEMRKLVESSVVQNPHAESAITIEEDEPGAVNIEKEPTAELIFDDSELVLDLDFDALTSEQQSRIREIEVAEDQRHLDTLKERYASILSRKEIALELTALQDELIGGCPLKDRLAAFENLLKHTYSEVLSEARVHYEWLAERLRRLQLDSSKTAPLQARLAVVLETLQAGGLPMELGELRQTLAALEAEDKVGRELHERQLKLQQAFHTLRAEAEASLSPFRSHAQVEAFLAGLAGLEPSETALQSARQQHSQLLALLAKEREEESLRRMGLKAAIQALPALEQLEREKQTLLFQIEQPSTSPIAELEQTVEQLVEKAKAIVASTLESIEARFRSQVASLGEHAPALDSQLAEAWQALAQGRILNPAPLERNLQEALAVVREGVGEELTRYEAAGRNLRGLGGEELQAKVAQLRALLQAGEIPSLDEIGQLLTRMRRAQEALRAELGGRIGALLEAYNTHKSVGGETVLRLKPLCDFLQSASDRLARLGAGGLLEVRRALEEAERLENQLSQEFQAAQSLLQELKGINLESLLDVFDTPSQPIVAPQPILQPQPLQPVRPAIIAEPAPLGSADALASFGMRGVEAVALIQAGKVVRGRLPFSPQAVQAVFDDLYGLAGELSGQSAQLAVISLAQSVLLMVPLGQKGLVILAEKALLSRLLAQVEKQREALEKV